MSLKTKKISQLSQRIRKIYDQERKTERGLKRYFLLIERWYLMLLHEFLRDDVKVRAESLAFLMIFSLLPLIAGAFFVFTVFTQFGFVQEALNEGMEKFLYNIPSAHRDFVRTYVLQFKDQYLESISSKSGTIGIFALFILIWIGLQTFGNIERMLNTIWSADRQRTFLEQVRNFLVVAVAAPLVLIAGLSVPMILGKIAEANPAFSRLPTLVVILKSFLTPLLVLLTFFSLYRYVPVRKVKWKNALVGALFATVSFEIANVLMRLYFSYGTNSAYGKAAIVPLIGFWIYVVWIIVILGAEVSYLMQNQKDIIYSSDIDPTLREGNALMALLAQLYLAMQKRENPVELDRLRACTGLASDRLQSVLDFLQKRKLIVECTGAKAGSEGAYALGCDPATIDLKKILSEFFASAEFVPSHALEETWHLGTDHWLEFYEGKTVGSALGKPVARRR
jgi:membrane protein